MFSKPKKSLAYISAIFCCAILTTAPSAAEQPGTSPSVKNIRDPYYIGLGLGLSFLKPEANSVAIKLSQDSDFSYRVFAGYQFDDHWAAELFWADMGQAEFSSGSDVVGIVEYQSFGVGGLYQYPLSENWGVFATAGVGRLRNSFQLADAERVEDSFIYGGAGVMWNMATTWDLRAEYDYYDTDAQMLSFNIVKRFGSATPRRIATLENTVQQQQVALAAVQAAPQSASMAVKKQETCENYSVELEGVVFAKSSVDLSARTKQILDEVSQKLLTLPNGITFEVRAHTDNEGTELYNYALSLARARNVRDYIAAQGIALSRIEAQGYGEWRPVESNDTEAGRDANRRAELVLIGLEKYVEDTGNCPKLAAP